jgi:hypothetical protein
MAGEVFVILATVIYALFFLNVYRGEHPWVRLSRWVYQNIPAGTNILHEHWDHQLPLTLVEEQTAWWPGIFNHGSIDLYAPDTPEKLAEMVSRLAVSDYLIIASNRLYGSTARVPERYPLTARYYESLFDGRLGYELVPLHEIQRQPRMGSIGLVTDPFETAGLPSPRRAMQEPDASLHWVLGPADESFTVYDHPQPLLFRNVARLSPKEMATIIGRQ